ncbi:MAG: molybdenum cofactor guanylyltransferase MobA [Alphaproteobacteria bacterium]|nr:molybdenum cofactor guanylyltransferase MobA [Alphaproteobacteria bacterium]
MAGTTAGLLLAGGLARRMGGGDKGMKLLAGKPILQHIIDRVRGQVDVLALNANGDPSRFSDYGLMVLPDVIEGYAGPLAGVLTGLDWAARSLPDCEYVATFPTDAPFLPLDLVARLKAAIETEGADMACARSKDRDHPVVGLWPVRLAEDLRHAMVDEDIRKVDRWTARHTLAVVDFPTNPIDPFFNANHPDDLAEAEALLSQSS